MRARLNWTQFRSTVLRRLELGALNLVVIFALCTVNAAGRDAEAELGTLSLAQPVTLDERAPGTTAPDAVCASIVLRENGFNSDWAAPNADFRGMKGVYLITAAELAAAGFPAGASPTAIGWHYRNAPGVIATGALTVYLQNTTDTVLSKSTSFASAIVGMTMVHNRSNTTLPSASAPFDIAFVGGSPFTYTGGGLYVAFEWRRDTGTLSTVAFAVSNTTLADGFEGSHTTATGGASDVLDANSYRAETRLTATINNEVGVEFVISLGSLAQTLVGPQSVQAVITNHGNALTNLPVSLDITGADAYSDVQTIPFMDACGDQAIVTFAPFTPGAIGSDTVTVSVPADEVVSNNSKDRPLDETHNLYSYKYPGSNATGGVGVNGNTADFLAKFTTTAAAKVSAISLEFYAVTATTYRVAIYPDSGLGTPARNPIYEDASDRTVALKGPVTVTLPSPVPVGPGTFFAGVEQTNTANAAIAFDTEVPIRMGTFYLRIPHTASTWTDFAPNNTFKPNIGVTLVQCADAAECSDNNLCTDDDCRNELCTHTDNSSTSCDDHNSCTDDFCIPETGCGHGNNAAACDDGNACTTGDVCAGGSCAGTPVLPPAELQNARFNDKSTLIWDTQPDAQNYDVVRGRLSALPVGPGGGDETCFDDLLTAILVDGTTPSSGTGFWYVTRAESACAVGTFGTQHDGTPRLTTTCP
jgi:hypothetical protein